MGEKNLESRDILGENLLAVLSKDEHGYEKLAEFLKEVTGINLPLNEKNKALMSSRLSTTIRDKGFKNYRDYARFLQNAPDIEVKIFVESLTTNKTEFFRESKHFQILTKELPKILEENKSSGRRELRVWCSAASTGQEPYTIGITLLQSIPDISQWSIKFLSSDIDTTVLKKASRGVYTERELEGTSMAQKTKFFLKDPGGSSAFKVSPQLRDMITFAQFNLMDDPYPFEHKFDIIFCRNVLIYFERDTAAKVILRLSQSLRKGGLLFIGHTETGIPKPDFMETLDVAAYRRKS